MPKSSKNKKDRVKRVMKRVRRRMKHSQVGGTFSGSASGDFGNSVRQVFLFVENAVAGGFGLVEAVFNGLEIAPDLYSHLGRSDEPTAENPDPAPNAPQEQGPGVSQ